MSSLTLVRHAQASFFAADYDLLSPLGERQARSLGQHWLSREIMFDEVYVGPRQRHQQTAAAVAATYAESGIAFPGPVVLNDLDEYDLAGILQRLAPELARTDTDFAGLLERQRFGETQPEQARNYQRMFEPLLRHWQMTSAEVAGVESWQAFQSRVERCLRAIADRPGSGRRIVAFTSGGFIGTAVQSVLGVPHPTALEINWRIRNAALTQFVCSRGRITLDSFNDTAHLAAPELVTYR